MGGAQKTNSAQTYDPRALGAFQNVISGAQDIAGRTNYDPATAMRVAGMTPYQLAGYGGISDLQGRYDPAMQQALAATGKVTQGINPNEISQWQSPYTQQVIDTTLANMRQSQGQQMQQVVGNEIAANASGGDRAALEKALLGGQQAMQTGQMVAGLENQGYNNAVQTALSNNAQMLQGAYGMGNLAQSGQALDLGQLSALIGAGGQLQGQQQAEYNAASQNASQQQMWPLQMQQWLANIVGGIGSLEGGTTTGTSKTSQSPGVLQWLGAIGAGASAMSDERLKENKKVIGKTFDDQPIYSYNFKGDQTTHLGLLAQNVEKSHPEAVGEYGGWKTVNYSEATKDAAKRGKFANGGVAGVSLAAGGFPSSKGGDPWSSLIGSSMHFQAPQQANLQLGPSGTIGGDTGSAKQEGKSAGQGLKAGWDKMKGLMGKGSTPQQGTDAPSDALSEAPASAAETGAEGGAEGLEGLAGALGFANGGFPSNGGDAWGSMLSQPMHFQAPASSQPAGMKAPEADFGGDQGGGDKKSGPGPKMPKGLDKLQPGNHGGSSAPAGTEGTGDAAINSNGWQSFFDPTFGAPGSASAATGASAATAGEGATTAAEGAAGVEAAGEGAAAAGEAGAAAGEGVAAASEAGAAAGAGAGEAASSIGAAIAALFAKRGGAIDTDYSKHLRSLHGGEHAGHAKTLLGMMGHKHEKFAAGGTPGEGLGSGDAAGDIFNIFGQAGVEALFKLSGQNTNNAPMQGIGQLTKSTNGQFQPISADEANMPMSLHRTGGDNSWASPSGRLTTQFTSTQAPQGQSTPPGSTPAPAPTSNAAPSPFANEWLKPNRANGGRFNFAEGGEPDDTTPPLDEPEAAPYDEPAGDLLKIKPPVTNISPSAIPKGPVLSDVQKLLMSPRPKDEEETPIDEKTARDTPGTAPSFVHRMVHSRNPVQLTPKELDQFTSREITERKHAVRGKPILPGTTPEFGKAPETVTETEEEAAAPAPEEKKYRGVEVKPVEAAPEPQPVEAAPEPEKVAAKKAEHKIHMPPPIKDPSFIARLLGAPADPNVEPSLVDRLFLGDKGWTPEQRAAKAAEQTPVQEAGVGRLGEGISDTNKAKLTRLSGIDLSARDAAAPVEAPAAEPAKPAGYPAPVPADTDVKTVPTFRVYPTEAEKEASRTAATGATPDISKEVPESSPYTANVPAPKPEPEEGPEGERLPMTRRLNFEGGRGDVSKDTGGMPSMGYYGLHGVKGDRNSSLARFHDIAGRELGFTADPVNDPWGYARQWREMAKNNPEGLDAAQEKWYGKVISPAVRDRLTEAGVPKSVIDDQRVKDYMGDRLVHNGERHTVEGQSRYFAAMRNVKEDDPDKAATFLKNLAGADKAAIAHSFRSYIAQNREKHPDIQQTLEKRVTNRLNGAMGQATQPGEVEKEEGEKQKTAAELNPAELKHANFLQKLVKGENPLAGWNPLEAITGPGKEGPGTDLLGMTGEQRRNLLQFSLGLMQGPFMGDAAKGAMGAMQSQQQMGIEQTKLGLEQQKNLIEAMKVPKVIVQHAANPITGEVEFRVFDAHTGQPINGQQGVQAATAAGNAEQLLDHQAQQLVDGELRLSQVPQKAREALLLRAQQKDSSWSPANEETRFKFRDNFLSPASVTGKKARSIEGATRHLAKLYDQIETVGGGDNVPLNKASNWYKQTFGGDTAIGSWTTTRQGLSDELGRLMSETGVGSEAEKQEWRDKFDPALSKAQLRANLASAIDLMEGQRDGLDQEWNQTMGPRAKSGWNGTSAKAKAVMDDVRGRARKEHEQRYGPATVPPAGEGQAATNADIYSSMLAGKTIPEIRSMALQAIEAAKADPKLSAGARAQAIQAIQQDAMQHGVRF
jgi:hypothetical protein